MKNVSIVSSRAACRASFLGAFAKLQNAIISSVMSVCLHGKTRHPLNGFL